MKKIEKIIITMLVFVMNLFYCDEFNYATCISFSGKRRALIPPSVGYINENLKPIPEEVPLSFNSLLTLFSNGLTFAFFKFVSLYSVLPSPFHGFLSFEMILFL